MAAKPGLFSRILRSFLRGAVVIGLLVIGGVFGRAWLTAGNSPLEPWHTYVPAEMSAAEMDASNWDSYVAAENRLFADVRNHGFRAPQPGEAKAFNRYVTGSPIDPAGFARDWNRSFVMAPVGPPRGVVVLLHGMTDAPYSLRHLGELYSQNSWLALGLRVPGHGTVPAALTSVTWEDWMAATRLAMREARRRAGPDLPIDIVGYSNGGALAVKYTLAALADPALPQVHRIVLLSPMIGVTEFARFAGISGWPAIFPAFAEAAWLNLMPEFNPYKYNSFPVNAARQSWRLSSALQAEIRNSAKTGTLARMPPLLTFQSVADSTVSTSAVVNSLYALLPRNGSELVLFDINRAAELAPLQRPAAIGALAKLLPPAPRNWQLTIITGTSPTNPAVVARSTAPGAIAATDLPLGLDYPSSIYSMTHVAIPFPASDGLYGNAPDPADNQGIQLGTLAARGERGVLVADLDTLLRLTHNPFYPYMAGRIAEGLTP